MLILVFSVFQVQAQTNDEIVSKIEEARVNFNKDIDRRLAEDEKKALIIINFLQSSEAKKAVLDAIAEGKKEGERLKEKAGRLFDELEKECKESSCRSDILSIKTKKTSTIAELEKQKKTIEATLVVTKKFYNESLDELQEGRELLRSGKNLRDLIFPITRRRIMKREGLTEITLNKKIADGEIKLQLGTDANNALLVAIKRQESIIRHLNGVIFALSGDYYKSPDIVEKELRGALNDLTAIKKQLEQLKNYLAKLDKKDKIETVSLAISKVNEGIVQITILLNDKKLLEDISKPTPKNDTTIKPPKPTEPEPEKTKPQNFILNCYIPSNISNQERQRRIDLCKQQAGIIEGSSNVIIETRFKPVFSRPTSLQIIDPVTKKEKNTNQFTDIKKFILEQSKNR